jgi:hypothetical protein
LNRYPWLNISGILSGSLDRIRSGFDGRKFRALPVNLLRVSIGSDNFSRMCLSIHMGQSLKGEDVVAVMDRLKQEQGTPKRISIADVWRSHRHDVDNGSEFISKALDKWAYENKVTLDFSRPGKPTAPDGADAVRLNLLTGVSVMKRTTA